MFIREQSRQILRVIGEELRMRETKRAAVGRTEGTDWVGRLGEADGIGSEVGRLGGLGRKTRLVQGAVARPELRL